MTNFLSLHSLRRTTSRATLVLVLAACSREPALPAGAFATLAAPPPPFSGESNLAVGRDGRVHLTWLERLPDSSHAVRFASYDGNAWTSPSTVFQARDLFVNWADFPSNVVTSDGRITVHWLQRSSAGKYSYDVKYAQSSDKGRTWSAPAKLHRDSTPTEHGFVSLIAGPGDSVHAFWLDGRITQAAPGQPPGPMQLRSTRIAPDGSLGSEVLLDDRNCDCCQSSAAMTKRGPVVAYRDRSPEEIRDIVITRYVNGSWTSPTPVYADNWHIEACPVNGPAVVANGDSVAVAWFTGARDTAKVQVAFSTDGGASFGEPVRVDDGAPAGRVALVYGPHGEALVAWLERTGEQNAEVRLRGVTSDGKRSPSQTVAVSSAARASGFPRMVRHNGDLIVSWTEPGDSAIVRVARAALHP